MNARVSDATHADEQLVRVIEDDGNGNVLIKWVESTGITEVIPRSRLNPVPDTANEIQATSAPRVSDGSL